MPFVKGDSRINRNGRPQIDRSIIKTNREIRDSELISLLRKVKPHIADSVKVAAMILKKDLAKDADRLKAGDQLFKLYRELVDDLYDGEDRDGEGEEVQPQSAKVFTLDVITNNQEQTPEK